MNFEQSLARFIPLIAPVMRCQVSMGARLSFTACSITHLGWMDESRSGWRRSPAANYCAWSSPCCQAAGGGRKRR
ncbi:MAG: hypothetical protein U0401_04840 [Anaerolineae bacterium]